MATIYMKVDGVKGRVSAADYKEHIELESCQGGASCPTQAKAGNIADITGGTISFSDMTVSRGQDLSTAELFAAMFDKAAIPEVSFKFVATYNKEQKAYMVITINNVWITNYSMSGHGHSGDRPSEMISFSYTKITYKVNEYDDKGTQTGTKTIGYDLKTMKKL